MKINERKFLLDLAKRAIENFLASPATPASGLAWRAGKELEVEESEVPESLRKTGACFVTLTIGGKLRGCIGDIEAYQPLYKNIIKNAIAAAFYDPRFELVRKEELNDLEIEISILGPTSPLRNASGLRGVKEIKKGDGVILEKDGRRAVFLPQVWEELPEKNDFLTHLALKAGLGPNDWKSANYEVFGVEIIN